MDLVYLRCCIVEGDRRAAGSPGDSGPMGADGQPGDPGPKGKSGSSDSTDEQHPWGERDTSSGDAQMSRNL